MPRKLRLLYLLRQHVFVFLRRLVGYCDNRLDDECEEINDLCIVIFFQIQPVDKLGEFFIRGQSFLNRTLRCTGQWNKSKGVTSKRFYNRLTPGMCIWEVNTDSTMLLLSARIALSADLRFCNASLAIVSE